MKDEGASQDWVVAGLAELATAGVDGVRVEVLAERLAVIKGGFYRRFKERRSLLDAILKTWRDGRIAAIERQVETGGKTAIYSERANAQGTAIELAIRQWARTDSIAAAATREVDAARLKTVSSLYRELGLSGAEVGGLQQDHNGGSILLG
jgi:AcrR family transcriptional regulator